MKKFASWLTGEWHKILRDTNSTGTASFWLRKYDRTPSYRLQRGQIGGWTEKFATFTLGIILVVFLLCKVIWYIEHGIFCRYSLQEELVVFEVKIKNFCADYYPPRVAPAELCCLYITGLHPSGLGSLSIALVMWRGFWIGWTSSRENEGVLRRGASYRGRRFATGQEGPWFAIYNIQQCACQY